MTASLMFIELFIDIPISRERASVACVCRVRKCCWHAWQPDIYRSLRHTHFSCYTVHSHALLMFIDLSNILWVRFDMRSIHEGLEDREHTYPIVKALNELTTIVQATTTCHERKLCGRKSWDTSKNDRSLPPQQYGPKKLLILTHYFSSDTTCD